MKISQPGDSRKKTNSYRSLGDSGKYIERWFCTYYELQLFTRPEALPGMPGFKAGTLDDASLDKLVIDLRGKCVAPELHESRFAEICQGASPLKPVAKCTIRNSRPR